MQRKLLGIISVYSTQEVSYLYIFCIRQVLVKKWKYNEAVHQLFIDSEKAYDSVRREVLHDILIEFGIPMKLAGLIKMCLSESYSRVLADKHLSDIFPVKNGLNQGDDLSPLLFNFALEYVSRRVQVNQDELKMNGTHQFLVNADAVNTLGGSVHAVKKNTGVLVVAIKIRLEVNAYKTKYVVIHGD